jgi:methylenetetrahydrofolate reductase (NADPH)
MKISEILKNNEVTISFEVFPPKTDDKYAQVEEAARKIAALHPSFMSVTYGAGGGTSKNTASIASDIQNRYGTPVLAHLTCVSSTKETVARQIALYKSLGIENVLALRGDIPKEGRTVFDYAHAVDLIHDIREQAPDLCLGGACYPEGHVECERPSDDLDHLKEKCDAGLSFLTTQMFFDNNTMYNFLYRAREKGITVPILAGIMPITNRKQVARSVFLSGATIPQRFRMMVDRFGEDPKAMQQVGIIYASEQIIDLISNGVTHIHVYSMNKPAVAAGIMANLSEVLK